MSTRNYRHGATSAAGWVAQRIKQADATIDEYRKREANWLTERSRMLKQIERLRAQVREAAAKAGAVSERPRRGRPPAAQRQTEPSA